jgi:hypothetical protein
MGRPFAGIEGIIAGRAGARYAAGRRPDGAIAGARRSQDERCWWRARLDSLDVATGSWVSMIRRDGVTERAAVAPRPVWFDVDLGRDSAGVPPGPTPGTIVARHARRTGASGMYSTSDPTIGYVDSTGACRLTACATIDNGGLTLREPAWTPRSLP